MKKITGYILLLIVCTVLVIGYRIYRSVMQPNVFADEKTEYFICIPTGSDFNTVVRILSENEILKDTSTFKWVSEKMKYTDRVLPGRYHITKGMSNKDLITLLRSGKQTPVNLTFNNLRTTAQLASLVSRTIEADSVSIMRILTDEAELNKKGFNTRTIPALFIPNTYEFYWNTPAEKFFERMALEYKKFWTEERKQLALMSGLSQSEISILASIVEQETQRNSEKSTIAGVYLNRLKRGQKLDADPTLVFALGNFTINRVLNEYKKIDSPYNTYIYTGLPPGPICIPSISSIDAVLHYSKHDYLFFCAREDFSGYHNFAKTYHEHLVNARKFQKELDKRNIRS